MDMHYTRKVFASWLIKEGIDSNTVDVFSGRCPQSVLKRHYKTPDASLKDKLLDAVSKPNENLRAL
jgi:hypothetical protein